MASGTGAQPTYGPDPAFLRAYLPPRTFGWPLGPTSLVVVRPAHVQGRSVGAGLFAAQPIARGTPISWYDGVCISRAEARATDPSHHLEMDSVLPVIRGVSAANARDGMGSASLANTEARARCPGAVNAALERRGLRGAACLVERKVLVATRDIAAGEEVLWDYGRRYWETLNAWRRAHGAPEEAPLTRAVMARAPQSASCTEPPT